VIGADWLMYVAEEDRERMSARLASVVNTASV